MNKYLMTALVLNLVFSMPLLAESTAIKTYILAGQSNANGYGLAFGETSSGSLIPNQTLADIGREDLIPAKESVYVYQGGWETATGEWGELKPGYASWNGVRFGPELSLGHKLQTEFNEALAIVKYTPNGTSLYSHWLEGRYDLLLQTINNAKADAVSRDLTLDIQGILWMQGESDSFGVLAPAAYEEKLTEFIAKVRNGLALPNLKFYVAEIANSDAWGARQQIWDAQAAIAAVDDNTFIINSRDFPLFENDASGSENIHFSTEGTVMLGEAFAASIVANAPQPATSTIPINENVYASQTVNDDSIVIDGELSEWSTLNSLGYDADTLQDVGIKADIVEGWIAHDNNNLYVAYQNSIDIDTSTKWAWQVYFDTDESASTGIKIEENVGAEYMLQGSGVFKYTGSGSDWSWQYVTSATEAYLGANAEFKIPRLAIGFPEQLKVVFKTRNVPFTGSYAKSGVDTYPKPFEPVQLHHGLLMAQSAIWQEPSGELAMTLAEPAAIGATQITMTEGYSLKENQLLTYLAEDGEYYTAQLATVNGVSLTLDQPLKQAIASGQNLWNFYGDASHPNRLGYRAMVDLAVRDIGKDTLNQGTHLLLGDSWFDASGSNFGSWLGERLPDAQIINRGVGGSKSADLVSSFDANVVNQSPNYIWVAIGINDATSDVLLEEYLSNMQTLISNIRALGAQPIIFDSQVAQLFSGNDARTQLSHSYAAALPNVDATLRYKLTEPVLPPESVMVSNNKTIAIDGDLADWNDLQSFGEDADDITEVDAKADFLEAWMAHDENSLYVAYRNDGEVDTQLFWPWQVYLDTDNAQYTGYQVGNEVGANFLIQGGALFSYIGTGYDWAWQYVEGVDWQANVDVVELSLPRQSLGNPDSMSIVLKARNGIFTNNFGVSGVDSFPDLDQGHFNYQFSAPEVEEVLPEPL